MSVQWYSVEEKEATNGIGLVIIDKNKGFILDNEIDRDYLNNKPIYELPYFDNDATLIIENEIDVQLFREVLQHNKEYKLGYYNGKKLGAPIIYVVNVKPYICRITSTSIRFEMKSKC